VESGSSTRGALRLEHGAVALFRFDFAGDRGDDAVADLGDDEDAAPLREARDDVVRQARTGSRSSAPSAPVKQRARLGDLRQPSGRQKVSKGR
jgi:hypothetical protein